MHQMASYPVATTLQIGSEAGDDRQMHEPKEFHLSEIRDRKERHQMNKDGYTGSPCQEQLLSISLDRRPNTANS